MIFVRDEINTHVKKRTFLEGLEEYVEWLEDQIRLAGHVPVTMYRVPTYPVREFRTQSIRVRGHPCYVSALVTNSYFVVESSTRPFSSRNSVAFANYICGSSG